MARFEVNIFLLELFLTDRYLLNRTVAKLVHKYRNIFEDAEVLRKLLAFELKESET